jgi:hypothetical protein
MVDSAQQRIIMTLLVRNEQDVIAENILFHYHQGVDGFIVMDNLSTDATVEVVRDLAQSIPIELRHQQDDTYSQSDWVTEMARAAAIDHGADWVINNDADEFWLFPDFDLRSYLHRFSTDVSAVILRRHNAVLIRGESWNGFEAHPSSSVLFERQSLNQLGSPLPGKCLHRASAQVTVQQGNHGASGLLGQTVHCDHASILHFPYRRFEQYQSKIRLGGAAYARNTQLQPAIGRTWREQHKIVDQPELTAFWSDLQWSPQRCIRGEMRGELFREPRLRATLQRLLDDWQAREIKRTSQQLMADTAEHLRRFVGRSEKIVGDMEAPQPRSLHFNNLPFIAQGPLLHQERLFKFLEGIKDVDPASQFTEIRNLISLFPRNDALLDWLASVLCIRHSHAVRRLKERCSGKTIILHITCRKYLHRSRQSVGSFADSEFVSLLVVGGGEGYPNSFGFEFDGELMVLPVPDSYEQLASKVFYAYLILHLCGHSGLVVKIDDDAHLGDLERFNHLLERVKSQGDQYCGKLIQVSHRDQCHGWHLGKCTDPLLHVRGYQYPMPKVYASGGFGYVVGPRLLQACALMYLSMQSFFEMNCIQLEDVFVGLAAQSAGIAAVTCEYEPLIDKGLGPYPDVVMAVLPGLIRLPDT